MRFILSLIIGLLPLTAFALNYDAELPYSDVAPTNAEKVSVGALTDEGILEGNPDGTFKYSRTLNRAEFMQITMRLVPRIRPVPQWDIPFYRDCFPDIASDAWFAEPVCLAKALGIVHGNAAIGVDPQFWFFEPSRAVQYEEAVKVLVNIYDIQTPQYFAPVEWYVPFIHAAEERGLALDLEPGHQLTRGQVSRLVARFVAFDQGELDLLLQAEKKAGGDDPIPTQEGTCEPYICDDGRAFPSCTQDGYAIEYSAYPCLNGEEEEEEEQEEEGTQYDPDPDLSAVSQFLMLGETSHVLGVAEIFSDTEPLDVTDVTIAFTGVSDLRSIAALSVYDVDGKYLGRANKDTSVGAYHYVLHLKNGTWIIPKRETRYLYVRAFVNAYKSGGVSGEVVDVQSITVEGDGVWSHRAYTKGTSENFNAFQTARSIITDIGNGGDATGLLYSGTDLVLGSYSFEGVTGDGSAELKVTDLTFQIEVNDSVTVSNVELGADGTNDRMDCTVSASTVTCSSIPEQFGTFKNTSRSIMLYGDVTVPAGVRSPRLSLTLNQPGSVSSAGSVTWTDGDTSFTWVPGGTPVARGTILSY
ncbi:S-layer homology domain-containing protein [Patescibacteria group bacterium]|nr:S-layer homology domain-containing protein [Patescibacteria group bacterium]MBU2260015.1 S-layer homology domain-containing protein [Patescibacteria group bacterium]